MRRTWLRLQPQEPKFTSVRRVLADNEGSTVFLRSTPPPRTPTRTPSPRVSLCQQAARKYRLTRLKTSLLSSPRSSSPRVPPTSSVPTPPPARTSSPVSPALLTFPWYVSLIWLLSRRPERFPNRKAEVRSVRRAHTLDLRHHRSRGRGHLHPPHLRR